jgi:nucleoside 2-deoxyribosyltransferase
MKKFRPFELLKLIRDNKLNVHSIGFMTSRESYRYHQFVTGLQKLKFVNMSENGEIVATEKLSLLLKTLDISLTQLENYSQDSLIFSPIFGLPSNEFEKIDVFMVMPFLENLKPVYNDHIQKVAGKLGVSIARGDDFFTSNSIISDIWNAINSCKIVIADCTGRNPNVFYEIGIAHTIGKPVIFLAQNKDDIPFDTQHLRHIIYEFTPRGMAEFEKKLTTTLKREVSNLAINHENKKISNPKKNA